MSIMFLRPIEDFDHAFQCPAPHQRRGRSVLRQELLLLTDRLNSDIVLVDVLINSLHHWVQDTLTAQ
jgi:hypothetical protein